MSWLYSRLSFHASSDCDELGATISCTSSDNGRSYTFDSHRCSPKKKIWLESLSRQNPWNLHSHHVNFFFMTRQAVFRFERLFTCLAFILPLKIRAVIRIWNDWQCQVTNLNFVNCFDVLLQIRSTWEGAAACFANKLLVITLMNLFDMRVEIWLCGESFWTCWARKCLI